jgi:hypothetical protein
MVRLILYTRGCESSRRTARWGHTTRQNQWHSAWSKIFERFQRFCAIQTAHSNLIFYIKVTNNPSVGSGRRPISVSFAAQLRDRALHSQPSAKGPHTPLTANVHICTPFRVVSLCRLACGSPAGATVRLRRTCGGRPGGHRGESSRSWGKRAPDPPPLFTQKSEPNGVYYVRSFPMFLCALINTQRSLQALTS